MVDEGVVEEALGPADTPLFQSGTRPIAVTFGDEFFR